MLVQEANSLQNTVRELQITLTPIFQKYKVKQVILFGSVSRGVASKKSDLDLLAILDTPLSFFERFDGIFNEIQRIVPFWGVDLLIYTPDELGKIKHRPFIKDALKSGILLYEFTED